MATFPTRALPVLALSAAIAELATAQSADSPPVEEVLVTAQRREQSLQDVALSVNPVSSEELDSRNVNDVTQLTAAAPSLQVGGDNTLSIRGIGTQIFSQTVDSSVAIALDDVNLGRLSLAGQPFNDVAQVEVLNGPQGLLFGKNASAGLVNIITNKPELGEYSGVVDMEYAERSSPGSSSSLELKGTLNLPVSENSALRLNLIHSAQDPVALDVTNSPGRQETDLQRQGIKAKYLYEQDSWDIYVIADYNEESGVGGLFERTYRSVGEGSPDTPGFLEADNIVAGPENLRYNAGGEYFRDLETGGLQATASVDVGESKIVNIAAWRYFDRDQNLDSDFTSGNGSDVNASTTAFEQISNELRYVLPSDGAITGQFGLYYFASSLDFESQLLAQANTPTEVLSGFPFCVNVETQPGPPPACNVNNLAFLGRDSTYTLDTVSTAGFGQVDYQLSDNALVFAGARVTRDELDIDLTSNQQNYFVNLATPGSVQESVSTTNFSFKLGGQYNFTDDLMVFASYGEGYKAPGFNDAIIPGRSLLVEDETSETVEVGVRSTFFDSMLTVNATFFHTTFDNYQAQSFSAEDQTFIIQNAASVTAMGSELDVTYLATDNFTLNWTASFLDSTFGDFPGVECYPGQPDPGCSEEEGGFFNAEGLNTPVSAEVASTLQGIYEYSLTDTIDGFVEANWYYRSEINYSQNNAPQTALGAVNIFGMSAGVNVSENWRFSVFCRNCSDEKMPTSIGFEPGDAAAGIATTFQTWGFNSVRSVGMTASYRF